MCFSTEKNFTILSAIFSPTSPTEAISERFAVIRLSIERNSLANFFATVSPTCFIPKANNTFSKGIFLDSFIELIINSADFSLIQDRHRRNF